MNSILRFSKMHGLGNDFVIVNNSVDKITFSQTMIRHLGHRHTGIGFDQLLIIDKNKTGEYICRIYNADGTEAEQCGNGMRCVARFIHEEKLTDNKSFSIHTKKRIVQATIHDYENIEVNMGVPSFDPADIPILSSDVLPSYSLELPSFGHLNFSVVSMGNPHAILFIDSVEQYPVKKIGSILTNHEFFPQGTNVGFVEIMNSQQIRLRTFERGVGETFACGSNACAAVVTGLKHRKLADKVKVELELGNLMVQWKGENHPVIMTGPATKVFSGVIQQI